MASSALCLKVAEQEGLEPPTLSGSRFQGGVFIQPGLLHYSGCERTFYYDDLPEARFCVGFCFIFMA